MVKKNQLILIVTTIIILLSYSQFGFAANNGISDSDRNLTNDNSVSGTSCGIVSCHLITPDAGSSLVITINPNNTTYSPQQTGIKINATVFFSTSVGGGRTDEVSKGGVMILNNDSNRLNIKNNGWIITKDPNNNSIPYNWNQYNISRSSKTVPWGYYYYNWTLTAPSKAGVYYINSHARWSDNSTNVNEEKYNYRINTSNVLRVRVKSTTWQSYNDSARNNVDNDFTGGEYMIYMLGTDFNPSYTYKVAYYDGANTKRSTETVNSDSSGNLRSNYSFTPYTDVSGTWNVQVFNASDSPPTTYNSSNTDMIADDSFYVQESAIPEFPAGILLPIAASVVLYFVIRKRSLNGKK